MILHALHQKEYLDVAKYYEKIWETPSVKEDEKGKGKAVSSATYMRMFSTDSTWEGS